MADYISNMSLSADGRFYSHHGRECEFIRYPFTLTSLVSGKVKRINNRDDLRRFLIDHNDAGAVCDINGVLDWIQDQSTWNGTAKVSRHEYQVRQMVAPGFLFLG
ncbi:MAG: hypothetical protein ABJP79_00705 [Tateyamaria sp.]|uniref:hypothetical protein n=1 Tax=Tateyamaria sp. TaxID=1929288 RepID=UPI00329E434D